jgi:hypothetical protein
VHGSTAVLAAAVTVVAVLVVIEAVLLVRAAEAHQLIVLVVVHAAASRVARVVAGRVHVRGPLHGALVIGRRALLHLDLTARTEVADLVAHRTRGDQRYTVPDRLAILQNKNQQLYLKYMRILLYFLYY